MLLILKSLSMNYEKIIYKNLDQILHCWLLIDHNDEIVHWSEPARHLLKYDSHEVIGQKFSKLLSDDEEGTGNYLTSLKRSTHSGALVNQKSLFRQKDGIIINVELSLQILNEENHNYVLLSFNNVTEVVELQTLVNIKMEEMQFQLQGSDQSPYHETMSEINDAVLVSITAGQGLRFNRAFMLLVDENEQTLKGVQAIGPGSRNSATEIYSNLQNAPNTLTEMIEHYRTNHQTHDSYLGEMINEINIPLNDEEHFLIEAIHSHNYLLINQECGFLESKGIHELRILLQVEELIVVPMVWHGHCTGLIIADNWITGDKISNLRIQSLTRFVDSAVSGLESMKLLLQLENSFLKIKDANLKIRESQALLIAQEKLAAEGQLVKQMAHEVRGPLSIIGGFARRIQRQMDSNSLHYDPLGRIIDTSDTLEYVLSDILDKTHKNRVPALFCDAVKLIHKVIALYEGSIGDQEISVNLNLPGDLPKVKIPEHHLFEIINNLIKNAVEAITESGLLSISAKQEKSRVFIVIQDNGVGLTDETMKKIFSPYFSTKSEGTGLGLVVVKKLIDEEDGELDIKSFPGVGSTFSVSFQSYESRRVT